MSTPPHEAEAAAALAQVREQIRARRSRLSSEDAPGGVSLVALRQSVDQVNDLWLVSAHLPITWSVPGVGTAIAYLKRATRLLLRWYINPLVEQQNRFNSAVARALVEHTTYQAHLTREWQLLDERLRGLEEGVAQHTGEETR